MDDDGVLDVIRRQHGVISRSQALAAGMAPHRIEYRLRSGTWVRLAAGVYRHGLWPPSWKARVIEHCLVLGAVASHRTAAVLHGIDGFRPGRVEVLIDHRRRQRPVDATVHQTTQTDRIDLVVLEGIPTTGLARTVLDVAAVVGPRRLEATIDDVVRTNRLSYAELAAVLDDHARRGRDGCGRLRAVLDERTAMPAVPLSQWSRDVAGLLAGDGRLRRPVLEHRVHSPGGGLVAQLDLAYPDAKLGIELDSVRHHLNRDSFERDPVRRNRLEAEGWTVLNFTWRFWRDHPDDLCDLVHRAYRLSTTPPQRSGGP